MREDFLLSLQEVGSDEEREWLVLFLTLESLPLELRDALWAAAVPHWFDRRFLAALLNKPSHDIGQLLDDLSSMSFIEKLPEQRYSVHERARYLLLQRLWLDEKEKYQELSWRAVSFCSSQYEGGDEDWRMEWIYHLILCDADQGLAELRDTAGMWLESNNVSNDKIESMLLVAKEHVQAGRVPVYVLGWILLWEAILDSRQSRYERAKERLLVIPDESLDDEELAREVRSVLNFIGGLQDNPEDLFLENLDSIRRIVRHTAGRSGLGRDDVEDFESFVNEAFIRNDYGIIRSFKGGSSFGTFLAVVVRRLLIEYQESRGRHWQPSAEAKRLGQVAKQLEALIYQDGYSVNEAFETVGSIYKGISLEELAHIEANLPLRLPHKEVEIGEEIIERVFERELQPDERLMALETAGLRMRVREALQRALSILPEEDRRLLYMKLVEGRSTVSIAKTRGIEAKYLYRKFDKIFRKLRSYLLRLGVSREDVREILYSQREFPSQASVGSAGADFIFNSRYPNH